MNHQLYYCGFKIDSNVVFPELSQFESKNSGLGNIKIRIGKVNVPDRHKLLEGPNWAIGHEKSYWWLDGVLKTKITAEAITVDADHQAPAALVRALILEAPMTIAMQYHSAFCLRVSAVSQGSFVKAFRFLPGGGSSTAAAWQVCFRNNHTVSSDTLLTITLDSENTPIAWPQGSGLLLWPKSRSLLKLNHCPMLEVRSELPVRRVFLPSKNNPSKLGRIEVAASYRKLHQRTQGDLDLVTARQPFKFVALRTAGRLWIDPIGKSKEHFLWCLSIAKTVELRKATYADLYPTGNFSAELKKESHQKVQKKSPS